MMSSDRKAIRIGKNLKIETLIQVPMDVTIDRKCVEASSGTKKDPFFAFLASVLTLLIKMILDVFEFSGPFGSVKRYGKYFSCDELGPLQCLTWPC